MSGPSQRETKRSTERMHGETLRTSQRTGKFLMGDCWDVPEPA